tara:strand:+ start:383 stop:832 length:450 start_codon:yes stop_codon:yes gene_type:complete
MKIIYLILALLILQNCQIKKNTKNHGINYLENRFTLLEVDFTNTNDTRKLFGYPHSKALNDENTWYYFERTITKGNLHKFGQQVLKNNNVIVLSFNERGILKEKKILNKNDMKNIKFSKTITQSIKTKRSFVNKFLGSIRQKMYGKNKF